MKRAVLFAFILLLLSFNLLAEEQVVKGKISDNQIEVTYKIPVGMHQTEQKEYFFVDVEETPGITFEETIYPEAKKDKDGHNEYHGTVTLIKKFTITDKSLLTSNTIKAYAGYQYCYDSGACIFPEEVELDLALNSASAKTSESSPKEVETQTTKETSNAMNILKYLLMAFIGGVILNIMPCVLPVLSIKAMSIVKQSQQDKKMIFKSSMAYTFGIVASFIVLALVIVILKTSGELVGWGFQFQNTGFVMGLLIIIFVFALSLFDVFIIRAPGMTAATKASAKGGLTGSFVSGIFAVLLATPCTAPFLGAALGFAFSQPPVIIFAIFILIGLGLAFPFILLGIWPKAIKIIPKPGEWMNVFKEAMGFLLFLTALYLIRSLYFLVGGTNLIWILLYLIILAFAAWIYGRFAKPEFSKKKQWIATILALFIAVGAGFWTLNFDEADHNTEGLNLHKGWQTFSPELVQEYRDEGKPVFIDFGAEWCLTCKTNETTVLHQDDIFEEFDKRGVQLLFGDNTKRDDTIGEWLRRFDRAGVPLYVFYAPGEEAVTLPEIITKDMVKKMLEKMN
jgi:thiol:disulfide interchange protein